MPHAARSCPEAQKTLVSDFGVERSVWDPAWTAASCMLAAASSWGQMHAAACAFHLTVYLQGEGRQELACRQGWSAWAFA